MQITIWGTSADGDSEVNDYANKEWAGLISGFYHPRCAASYSIINNTRQTPDRKRTNYANKEWAGLISGFYHPVAPPNRHRYVKTEPNYRQQGVGGPHARLLPPPVRLHDRQTVFFQ